MNTQELLNVLKVCGATLFGILAMHGYMTQDQASTIMTDLTIAVPALLSAGSVAWSIWSHWNMKKVGEHTVVIDPVVTNSNANLPSAKVQLPQGTVIGKVVNILIVAFVLSAFLAGAAQAQRLKTLDQVGQDIKNTFQPKTLGGVTTTGDAAYDILKMLDAKLLPDLTYAKALADANGNKLTSGCWSAWIDLINTNENAVKNQDGTSQDPPDPHLVTTLERAVDIRNALQPSAPFMVACSPVANLIKTDVLNFIGQVVGGGLSLTKLVPLL